MTVEPDLFESVPTPPPPRRIGRRIFLPATVRVRVEELRRAGAGLQAIADEVGVSVATIRTRCRAELDRGLPGGRRAGRPRWRPTAGDRAEVERLASEGLATKSIAGILGVSAPTLRLHCAADLAAGRTAGRIARGG